MDFSEIVLEPELEEFWRSEVAPVFDELYSDAVIEREQAEGNGFDPHVERELGARGWLQPTAARDAGGAGLDARRGALIVGEEQRRAGVLLPVKGSHELVMDVVHRYGGEVVKAEVLPGAIRGEIKCCLGYTEPDCGSDAAAVKTRAVLDGDHWILTGQKMFSTGAHLCQYVMATARTNSEAPKHRGITLFLVALDQPRVATQGIETLGGERTNFVYFDEAVVPDTHRLGPVDQGWQVASGALAAEHGMDAAHGGFERAPSVDADLLQAMQGPANWQGVLVKVLDAAVAWAKTTTRADGTRPIDDPLVRRRLARVVVDIALCDATPSPFGRVLASDALIRATADLVDLVGPEGLLRRSEPASVGRGVIEWAHRFAQGTSIYGGTTDIQRNLIAEQFLSLPRHRGALRA
jgi:alkylation response protein AidB-like acyl-CoA dehydrogenase